MSATDVVADVIETSVGPCRCCTGSRWRCVIRTRGTAPRGRRLRVGWEAGARLLPRQHRLVALPATSTARRRAAGSDAARDADRGRRSPWSGSTTRAAATSPRRLSVTLWPLAAAAGSPRPRPPRGRSPRHLPAVAARPARRTRCPAAPRPIRGPGRRATAHPCGGPGSRRVGPGNGSLGWAHADDRGEFVLVAGRDRPDPVQRLVDVDLELTGPASSPSPAPIPAPDPDADPLADLTVEPVAASAEPARPGGPRQPAAARRGRRRRVTSPRNAAPRSA